MSEQTYSPDQLEALYARFLDGSASEAQIAVLFSQAALPGQEALFRKLMDQTWDQLAENGRAIQLAETQSSHQRIRLAGIVRWAAAAMVTAVVSATIWWQHGRTSKKLIPAAFNIRQDIQPGGPRATLTLGNGKTILLDSAADGVLAHEGHAAVKKTGSGMLVYSADHQGTGGVTYNTLTTPRGGVYNLVLPDGTRVWLNAASTIRYPTTFAGAERIVSVRGEAYFEVAKNAQSPFHVRVSGPDSAEGLFDIRVLGTHFNVNAYADENLLKTTLLEGRIEFSGPAEKTILRPAEQVTADLSGAGKLHVIRLADADKTIAWKNGFFQFSQADIQTVMRQLSRWYDVNIYYSGPIPIKHFGGKIQRDLTLNELLDVLAKSQIHYRLEGKNLTVTP